MLRTGSCPEPHFPGNIPNYDLVEPIGQGAFGQVWLARERLTNAPRAIKIIPKDDSRRAEREIEGVKRYQQCAHNHPHLLQILTVGEIDNHYYCVMPLADNADQDGTVYTATTFRTWMLTNRVGSREALSTVAKLLSAVIRLHEQHLAHYDVKPENILIVDGEPKLADVGLVASLAADAPRSGTLAYMTPDGHPNDCYAIGKILYELVTGLPAEDFPSLPTEILDNNDAETRMAIRAFNRACHPEPASRYQNADRFAADVQSALATPNRRTRTKRWWQQRSSTQRTAITATVLTMCLAIALAIDAVHARFAPHKQYATNIDLSNITLNPPPSVPAKASQEGGRNYQPYLSLGDVTLDGNRLYTMPLPAPSEYFILDFHLRSMRPWGVLEIGVSSESNGRPAFRTTVHGQPNGLGLSIIPSVVNELGVRKEAGEGAPPGQNWILGHPQPGIDYILRLARFGDTGSNDQFGVALWPMAMPKSEPLAACMKTPSKTAPVRFITLRAATEDPHSHIELLAVHVSSYSAPHTHLTFPSPVFTPNSPVPALVPQLSGTDCDLTGNILAGPCGPYASEEWTSIGNWSWWSDAAPNDDSIPKAIFCAPFSPRQRKYAIFENCLDGVQFLRFDGRAFKDFEATMHIRLINDAEAAEPFPLVAAISELGIAFAIQDNASPGNAWGGCHIAGLHFSSRTARPQGFAKTVAGYVITGATTYSSISGSEPQRWTNLVSVPETFKPFSAKGFDLKIRNVNSQVKLWLNDHPFLTATSPQTNNFHAGRVALYSRNTIAHFDSLTINPL